MKKAVVVDTSLVLKWVLNESDSNKALALLNQWGREEVTVRAPALLAYEAANSLYQQARSGRISLDAAKQGLRDVVLKGLKFDFSSNLALSIRAIELAHHFGLLATYDTHYLALAEREGCELWTADTRMWKVVKGELDWVHALADYSL